MSISAGIKLTISGAGSLYAPVLFHRLVQTPTVLNKLGTITLFDANPERLKSVGEFCQRILAEQHLPIEIKLSTDPKEAFATSNVVFNMIRAGHSNDITDGMLGRLGDELYPLQDGLFGQETLGLGGFRLFLRQVRAMDGLLPHIPSDAILFNFANPAGMLTQYCGSTTAGPKTVLGLCNIPFELRVQIAIGLQARRPELLKFSTVDLARQIDIDSIGVNHFTFFRNFRYEGKDIFGDIIDCITRPPANFDAKKNIENLAIYLKIAQKYGVFPNWYFQYRMDQPGEVARLLAKAKNQARAWVVREWEIKQLRLYQDGTTPIGPIIDNLVERGGGADYASAALLGLDGMINDTGERHVINSRNIRPDGTPFIGWLPVNTVIEGPFFMTKDGPVADVAMDTELPAEYRQMVLGEALPQNLWVDAQLIKGQPEQTATLMVEALTTHSLIGQRIPAHKREGTVQRILKQIDKPWVDPEWPKLIV